MAAGPSPKEMASNLKATWVIDTRQVGEDPDPNRGLDFICFLPLGEVGYPTRCPSWHWSKLICQSKDKTIGLN